MGLSIGFGYSGKKFYGRDYTLSQLMDKEFNSSEEIEDQFYCSTCKAHSSRCRKAISIYRAPTYLWIHMKRFKKSTFSCTKIDEAVDVPLKLDMSPYLMDKKSCTYNLFGIIHHHGTINRGHYTADCKTLSGKWFHFDDEVASQKEPLLNSSSAFVLFYKLD